ncbi:MAG TPA: YesL family protein [Aggregatilinea sp.]|uniref:YesL family protein n=1 Tax=Aggregatilinea sp. TaxID=2806333 RepID=UPI002BE4EF68|nr:YesL family protein [Aggregatilinea sp.]HML23752.1 YesL family protein [Aggregatilinea sp.]
MPRLRVREDNADRLWEAYYQAGDLIVVNLLWVVTSLPVITAVPALGALFHATNRLAHGSSAGWRVFWEGFREQFWLSWRWAAINAAAFGVLGVNVWFYGWVDADWAGAVQTAFVILLALWGELTLFTFPLLLEQSDRRFVTALRNSAVMLLRQPGPVLWAVLLVLAVAVPSVLILPPAWIIISGSLCAYLANRAVVQAIRAMKESSG